MAFERARFGDGSDTGSGNVTTAVSTHYNEREVGDTTGVTRTAGYVYELAFDVSGDVVTNEEFALLAPKLPAGAVIKNVHVVVEEVFVVTGTTPTINIGTETSETTNGIEISEAQAEALGTYDITSTLAGTWAAPLAAETTIGVTMDGTTPAVTSAGKMQVVIEYFDATK